MAVRPRASMPPPQCESHTPHQHHDGSNDQARTAVATGGSAESAIYGRGDGIDWYNEVSLSLMTGVET
jgi:hypothetical protein